VYLSANWVRCYNWHGGGGGYGDVLSLRRTQLDRDQIMQTVACGRPGTGSPNHLRGAHAADAAPCDGLTRQEPGSAMPPEAAQVLRPPAIAVMAHCVIAAIKGKGEPHLADCEAFFRAGARECNVYPPPHRPVRPTRLPGHGPAEFVDFTRIGIFAPTRSAAGN
jgi:hypothetical protein